MLLNILKWQRSVEFSRKVLQKRRKRLNIKKEIKDESLESTNDNIVIEELNHYIFEYVSTFLSHEVISFKVYSFRKNCTKILTYSYRGTWLLKLPDFKNLYNDFS
jgi:hypothetical protein